MIDILMQLGAGFIQCLTPLNLAMLVIGIVVGLLVGVLPGLTLVMGVALALPFTYNMDVTPGIVLLTAMYVSGTYGGPSPRSCSGSPASRSTSPCSGTATPWPGAESRRRRWAGPWWRPWAVDHLRGHHGAADRAAGRASRSVSRHPSTSRSCCSGW